MATKTKKPRKSKETKSVEVVQTPTPVVAQPVKVRMLPHNMAHEIVLLQNRVAELEEKLASVLEQLSTK